MKRNRLRDLVIELREKTFETILTDQERTLFTQVFNGVLITTNFMKDERDINFNEVSMLVILLFKTSQLLDKTLIDIAENNGWFR